jgi:hypothetical protein
MVKKVVRQKPREHEKPREREREYGERERDFEFGDPIPSEMVVHDKERNEVTFRMGRNSYVRIGHKSFESTRGNRHGVVEGFEVREYVRSPQYSGFTKKGFWFTSLDGLKVLHKKIGEFLRKVE